ncbi:MAG: RDD family protein [Pseudomonadota bacterium]
MGIPDPHTDPQFYENVPIRRLAAFVVDTIIIFAIWVVLIFVGSILSAVTLGLGAPLVALAFSISGFAYRWLLVTQRSATLGMMLTGIEIRDAAGNKLNPTIGFVHTFAYYVTLFILPLAIIGWVLMASSAHRRAMHDTFLGTVVINRPA